MKTTLTKTSFKNQLTLALYKDGKNWVAHNLTLDIVGVDRSKKRALDEMRSLTESQVTFAVNNNMAKAINHPAPARFWTRVAERINTQLVGQLTSQAHAFTSAEMKRLLANSPIYDLGPKQRLA